VVLESHQTEQGAAAAYALGLLADERTIGPLVKVLDDPNVDPKVRGHAVEALAHLADNRAANHVVTALKDPSDEVRYWAAFALGPLRHQKALPELRNLATNDKAVLAHWGSN
jgi:HEAT repeat protein